MKKISLFLIANVTAINLAFSQGVAINTNGSSADNSAILDASSSNRGILTPRLTTAQRNAIVSPANGLLVYNTDCNDFCYYNGSVWVSFGNGGSISAPGTITGNTAPCINSTGEVYSVQAVPGAINYNWSVSPGITIVSGQGTTFLTVDFGTASGSICVTANNQCAISSASCLPITLLPSIPPPSEGTHVALSGQIEWNWNTVSGATGYKWNTVDDYNSATDMGTNTTNTETSLNCETDYTRYVWAYNACGESASTAITETTGACCADATGGTITHVGGNTIHTFTYPGGTFTPSCAGDIQILVVAGGGGGGAYGGGGGGAGGLIYNAAYSVIATPYTVTVGNGGAGGTSGTAGGNGNNSVFSTLTAVGGGGGAGCATSCSGLNGGSGGGGCADAGTLRIGGTGTSGQGYNGGTNGGPSVQNPPYPGGGGGGANAAGQDAPSNTTGGYGGAGLSYSVSGSSVTYAGGGGGGTYNSGGTGGAGGSGGGGAGCGTASCTATSGTANSGGGGGGSVMGGTGGAGGSGIVIISYPTPNCSTPSAPTADTHTPSDNQIIWNWNASAGATGYKWNTVNTYSTATDNGASISYTQAGLNCNTAYTLYVWAYNTCGNSGETTLSQSTTGAGTVPSAPTAGTHVPATDQIEWNWNTSAGATGYKYNTSDNYLTASDNGTSTTYTQTGLNSGTVYTLYVWAYNSCGHSVSTTLTDTTTDAGPASISGLYLWYDADDPATITYSSGTSVSQWDDKSGNNFHATQGTVSYQPNLVTGAFGTKPAMRFVAANGSCLYNTGFTINLASRTMFVVVKENSAFCYSGVVSIRGSSPDYLANDGYIFGNVCNTANYNMINNRTYYDITPGPTGGSGMLPAGIYAEQVGSGTGTAYFNGTPFGTTGNSTYSLTSLGGMAMGRRYDTGSPGVLNSAGELTGDIAEVIMYNRPLTTNERNQIGAYLANKYGLTWTP